MYKKIVFIIFSGIILFLAGVFILGDKIDNLIYNKLTKKEFVVIENKEDCIKAGGSWGKPAIAANNIASCFVPPSDAGKFCISGFQCITGDCRIDTYGRDIAYGLIGGGKCSSSFHNLGTYYPIHFGLRHLPISRMD